MWDWLSIIVIIAIVLVVLDGLRRKFREKNALKIKLDSSVPGDVDSDHNSELPSGGARTIARGGHTQQAARRRREVDTRERVEPAFGDVLDDQPPDDFEQADAVTDSSPTDTIESAATDDAADFEVETIDDIVHEAPADVPDEVLDEVLDKVKETSNGISDAGASADEIDNPISSAASFTDEAADTEDNTDSDYDALISPQPQGDEPLVADRGDAPETRSVQKKVSRRLSERFFRHSSAQSELPLNEAETRADAALNDDDSQREEGVDEAGEVEEVIIINVMAPQGQPFEGAQLLQILLRQGMRLGQMSIFHRHADHSGSGPVMFSMANMVKPGTFDMSNMDSFTTPGVSLFTQLPSRLRHMRNFELMLETAQCLRDELNGELKDENRSVLTRQTIEHYRQRIRDFELQRLARK